MVDCQTRFDIDLKTEVIVDAGLEGVGAILTQIGKDGQLRVCGFGSRTLTDVENYIHRLSEKLLV